MELRDKVVVVTGGASGIGTGLCRRFREEGVRGLVIADLNGDAAAELAAELDGRSVSLDVRDEAAIAAMVADTEAEFGQIDLFCSNAGILNLDGDEYWATSSDNDVWQRNWEIHVMAHIYAARACLPGMIKRGEGYFLHTVSAAGLLTQPYTAAYATTKHAAIGFAESLAITHGDDGVRVSCLCPQAVDTAMLGGTDGGAVPAPADTDGDMIEDRLDLDTDNDGIPVIMWENSSRFTEALASSRQPAVLGAIGWNLS